MPIHRIYTETEVIQLHPYIFVDVNSWDILFLAKYPWQLFRVVPGVVELFALAYLVGTHAYNTIEF